MVRKGVFIAIEGIPGAGKSRLARAIVKRLNDVQTAAKLPSVSSWFDGQEKAMHAADRFAKACGVESAAALEPLTGALLNAAVMNEMAKVVRPVLTAGGVIVCDTFSDFHRAQTGAVFTGKASDVPASLLDSLLERAVSECTPDLTLLLDGDAPALTARKKGFLPGDTDALRTAIRTREALRYLSESEAYRYRVIDALMDERAVERQAWVHVKEALNARGIRFSDPYSDADRKAEEKAEEKAKKQAEA
jgi:thymidylate kinase